MRFLLLLITALPIAVSAQEVKPKPFTLFHPLPKELMREDMETDRPDVTESPYTVDAGHIQFESDFFRYKSGGGPAALNRQYLFAPFTFKIGLNQATDLQITAESYRSEYHKTDSTQEEHFGSTGSVSLRVKRNLYGNDSGVFAIAIMPYLKLPANRFFDHHKVEGGIIIPAQWKITEKLALGFQEEVDIVAEDDDYEIQALQSVVLSYDLLKKLKVIAETYGLYHFGEKEFENYINIAFQFFPVRNFAIDCGVMYGFQTGSEHHYYVGMAWRL